MVDYKITSRGRGLAAGLALFTMIAASSSVGAQNRGYRGRPQIDSGTTVQVRTIDPITSNAPDGRVYEATVESDVLDNNGELAIPRGSVAELIVRRNGDELMLDLDSITVDGQRYAVTASTNPVGTSGGSNLGINRETGQYVGGGAVLGAIIGAVAGGAKGAAIGAGVGAAAGAGVQVATHGRSVNVPAETLLMYQVQRPLDVNVPDNGYTRDGYHYHPCC